MEPFFVERVRQRLVTLRESRFRNALVQELPDSALEQASALDKTPAQEMNRLPLAGLVFVVKDNIDVYGQPSKIGSPGLSWSEAARDAWVVETLKAAGAVLLGKSHMNEFAAGLDGCNDHYPRLKNPRYENKLTGGSSSGSAVAAAAGLVDFAIGTDTGGSIRIPGCWNGVWGLRLGTDPLQLAGVFPRSPSLDALGVVSQSLECIFRVARALGGFGGTMSSVRLGYDPSCLKTMRSKSRARFLEKIQVLSSRFELYPIDLSDLLNATDKITQLLKAEFHEIFSSKFPDPTVYKDLGPVVSHELKASSTLVAGRPHLQKDLSSLGKRVLERTRAEVDFLLTPLCLDEAPDLHDDHSRNDRFYTVALSLLGCPVLGIPYPDVADGYQLTSLHGNNSCFESLALELSRL